MNGCYSKPPLYLFGRSNPSLRHCKGRLFYFQSSPSCYVKDGEAAISQRGSCEAPVGCGRSSHLQKPGCGRRGLAGVGGRVEGFLEPTCPELVPPWPLRPVGPRSHLSSRFQPLTLICFPPGPLCLPGEASPRSTHHWWGGHSLSSHSQTLEVLLICSSFRNSLKHRRNGKETGSRGSRFPEGPGGSLGVFSEVRCWSGPGVVCL